MRTGVVVLGGVALVGCGGAPGTPGGPASLTERSAEGLVTLAWGPTFDWTSCAKFDAKTCAPNELKVTGVMIVPDCVARPADPATDPGLEMRCETKTRYQLATSEYAAGDRSYQDCHLVDPNQPPCCKGDVAPLTWQVGKNYAEPLPPPIKYGVTPAGAVDGGTAVPLIPGCMYSAMFFVYDGSPGNHRTEHFAVPKPQETKMRPFYPRPSTWAPATTTAKPAPDLGGAAAGTYPVATLPGVGQCWIGTGNAGSAINTDTSYTSIYRRSWDATASVIHEDLVTLLPKTPPQRARFTHKLSGQTVTISGSLPGTGTVVGAPGSWTQWTATLIVAAAQNVFMTSTYVVGGGNTLHVTNEIFNGTHKTMETTIDMKPVADAACTAELSKIPPGK